MKLEFKLSLTATLIIIVLAAALEFSSINIFRQSIHSNTEKLLADKLDRLILKASEQDELFFEGFYHDVTTGQERFIDKLRIDYRKDKDPVTYPFIIDTSGSVILHPQEQKGYQFFGRDVVSNMVKQQHGHFAHTHRGVHRHFIYKIFKPWGWIFCETTTEDFLYQALYAFTKTLLGVSIFMIILSSLVILFSSRAYVRPLYLVIEKLKDIAQSKAYSSVDIKASGEMKMLVDSFNKMAIDLHEATRKLKDEKERLNITLQSIGDGVIATDVEAKVVLMNKVAEQLTGWTQEEARGQPLKNVFNIVNAQTRQPCEDPVEKAIKLGTIVLLENNTVLISRDGSERIIADSGSPIRDDTGNIIGVVLVFRDNTERRRKEEVIRRLSRAVEFSPSTVIITDTQGTIEYVNPKFEEITGYSQEETIGKIARILRKDKLPPEKTASIWTTISSGKEWRGEFLNKKKDGTSYWEFVSIASIKDSQGSIAHYLIIMEDITQRRNAEQAVERKAQELAQAYDKLKEKTEALERFNNIAVEREFQMIALKKEINALLEETGRPKKYKTP